MQLFTLKIPGIYKIFCGDNFYIGSTSSIGRRLKTHKRELESGTHCNRYLQRSYNKHKSLKIEILEYILPETTDNLKTLLLVREQFFIDTLKPKLNLCLIAGSNLGIKWSERSRDKLSKSKKGIKFSEKHKKNLSKARKGGVRLNRRGIPMSAELKEKLRLSNLGVKQSKERIEQRVSQFYIPIYQYSLEGELIKKWSNIKEASLTLGYSDSCISRCSRNLMKTYKKYIWRRDAVI